MNNHTWLQEPNPPSYHCITHNYWLWILTIKTSASVYLEGLKVASAVAPPNNKSQNQIIHQSWFIIQNKRNKVSVINPCMSSKVKIKYRCTYNNHTE
jgi:hypothetical protein